LRMLSEMSRRRETPIFFGIITVWRDYFQRKSSAYIDLSPLANRQGIERMLGVRALRR